jgi:hypothetical protein
MGVGERTLDGDVDIAVSSLCGITFDGKHLTIPREVIIEAKWWSAASGFQTQMIQHSLAHFVLRAASASDWAPCEQHDRKAVELANHAELTLTGDSYRTR